MVDACGQPCFFIVQTAQFRLRNDRHGAAVGQVIRELLQNQRLTGFIWRGTAAQGEPELCHHPISQRVVGPRSAL